MDGPPITEGNMSEQTQGATPPAEDDKSKLPALLKEWNVNERGLTPSNAQQLWWFCCRVAVTKVNGIEHPEDALIVIQTGMELGFTMMQAVQNIYFIDGKTSIYTKAARALILKHPLCEKFTHRYEGSINTDDLTCIVTAKRQGHEAEDFEFSMDDAKRAKLWGKTGRNGGPTPWVTYPKRMLLARATSYAADTLFSDILCGVSFVEVMEDVIDITPQPAAPGPLASAAEGLEARQRKRAERQTVAAEVVEPEAEPADDEPEQQVAEEEAAAPVDGQRAQWAEDEMPFDDEPQAKREPFKGGQPKESAPAPDPKGQAKLLF